MALNTLEFANKFAGELDKVIVGKSVTGFMADNVLRAKFVGAKSVIIPDIDFVGLADYDRDGGFSKGKMTVAHTTYELSKDRARSLQIDREDMDESGIAGLAGQILSEYVRTMVVPEMDAYAISKLAKVATDNGNTVELDTDAVYEQFAALVNNIQGKTGFDTEMVAFVNPDVYAAFMNSDKIQKQIIVSDFKQGEVNLKVKKLNDVAIIPVADERMKTEYEFVKDGTDASVGGFTAKQDAKNIGMLILPKNAASLVRKSEKIRIFEPDSNPDADAYKFDYRVYYDVFVKKSNLKNIAAAISQ